MKPFTILSLVAVPVSLCLGVALSPTPTASPIATLTLGEDVAQNNWQVYPPNRSPRDIPPGILASLDLKARSLELNTRAGAKLFVTGLSCGATTCVPQGQITLGEGQKANFAGPADAITYRGGTVGCHITLYDKPNEPADASKVQIFFTAIENFPVSFAQTTDGPLLFRFRSVGYFC